MKKKEKAVRRIITFSANVKTEKDVLEVLDSLQDTVQLALFIKTCIIFYRDELNAMLDADGNEYDDPIHRDAAFKEVVTNEVREYKRNHQVL